MISFKKTYSQFTFLQKLGIKFDYFGYEKSRLFSGACDCDHIINKVTGIIFGLCLLSISFIAPYYLLFLAFQNYNHNTLIIVLNIFSSLTYTITNFIFYLIVCGCCISSLTLIFVISFCNIFTIISDIINYNLYKGSNTFLCFLNIIYCLYLYYPFYIIYKSIKEESIDLEHIINNQKNADGDYINMIDYSNQNNKNKYNNNKSNNNNESKGENNPNNVRLALIKNLKSDNIDNVINVEIKGIEENDNDENFETVNGKN